MKSLQEQFDDLTIPEPNSGCLLWLGAPTGLLGHGQMKVEGRVRMASHIALELAGRALPKGMFACHMCDNPACVEETHLFHGTQKDNVHDAIRKGRHNMGGLGIARGWNKLPEETKQRALDLYAIHGPKPTFIARSLDVPLATVYDWIIEAGHKPWRGSQTHCKHGHQYPENKTWPGCRICKNEKRRKK